jgi:cytochrome subunit of sulfide dehydrogenase
MLLRALSKRIGDRKYRDGAGLSMRKNIAVSISAGSFIILADRSQAADRDGGAQLAAMCASCHRPYGGDGGIPTILGMSPEMLTRAMLAYRSRERPSHIMRAIALSLSDEEIATVARYLVALNK